MIVKKYPHKIETKIQIFPNLLETYFNSKDNVGIYVCPSDEFR
jgi:hypothetical protein